MPDTILNESAIRRTLRDCCDHREQSGLEAFVVMGDEPHLKRMVLSETPGETGENFRTVLKRMLFEVIECQYLSEDAAYADGRCLADNQHKNLIIEQSGAFHPFSYLSSELHPGLFGPGDLEHAVGLIFRIRKEDTVFWLYQHLWSIMIPNKKKTSLMTRIMHFEDQTVFSEQVDQLLTIAKKIDILIMEPYLITDHPKLLEQRFSFHTYIYQSAQQSIDAISGKGIVESDEKLRDYIARGRPKYAKKMMRIGNSRVFGLSKEALMQKITTLDRWKDKFTIDAATNRIHLNTYREVESLIDLFDERYTRSDVTDAEYDTDVKTAVPPTA